jgi:hypothetical protein
MARKRGLTEEEQAAMKDRLEELRTGDAGGDAIVLAKIAEMGDADRGMAERVHTLIREAAPDLVPRLWYGMPAYSKDGKVVCFFQPAGKFKVRYSTLGFNDTARLDDGQMWPISYALTEVTPAVEKRITALVRQAVSCARPLPRRAFAPFPCHPERSDGSTGRFLWQRVRHGCSGADRGPPRRLSPPN